MLVSYVTLGRDLRSCVVVIGIMGSNDPEILDMYVLRRSKMEPNSNVLAQVSSYLVA